jgi:hypothetical protein
MSSGMQVRLAFGIPPAGLPEDAYYFVTEPATLTAGP